MLAKSSIVGPMTAGSDIDRLVNIPQLEDSKSRFIPDEAVKAHKRNLKDYLSSYIDNNAENLGLSILFVYKGEGNGSPIMHWYRVSLKAKVRHHLPILARMC